MAWGIDPACSKKTEYIRILFPSVGYHWCLNAADTLSGYSVADAVPVQSSDSRYSIVALKLNYAMFPAFQIIYNLITVHSSFGNGHQIIGQ